MNKKYKILAVIFIFIDLTPSVYAQNTTEKVQLTDVLTLLEDQHKYHFSYAHNVVQDVYVVPPNLKLSFKEKLKYLEKATRLIFHLIDNNIVTIKPPLIDQEICGYLMDIETNLPIGGASISYGQNLVISDDSGFFRLIVNRQASLINTRHIAYKSVVWNISNFEEKECAKLFLNPSVQVFKEIILTNYITKGIDKLNDGSIEINFSDFGILPGLIETDVLHTVQALPGISSSNERVSDINIRGGTHDQNLVLWDGIKMYQSGHFFGLISIFSPLITTTASVVKNGTNAQFSDGVSGTISMKTDTKINQNLSGSISLNFLNADGFIDVPIGKKSSVQISARKGLNDLVETPTYTKYFQRILQDTEIEKNTSNVVNSDIKFDFYDTSLRWLYDLSDKDQIRVNFININNELVFKENAIINQQQESKESSLNQNSIAASLFFERKWNNRFTSNLQFFETSYALIAENSDILRERRLNQENKVSESSFKLNNYYKSSNTISLMGGYGLTETIVTNSTKVDDPSFIELVKEVIREHALFTQISFKSAGKMTNLSIGGRYSYIEKFKKHLIEPRVHFNQKIVDKFSLEILGELKHQNTSQIINFQNDFLGIEKRRWLLSNNMDIPIIQSKQASLGVNFKDKGWLVSLDGYSKIVDGITSQGQGFLNQFIFERKSGSYRVKGIDLLVNKKIDKFSFWLGYGYADNKYTFMDFQNSDFPNNIDIRHVFTLGTSFSSNNFNWSMGLNWHSGKPTTNLVSGIELINDQLNFQTPNSARLDEYLRIDASATYQFQINTKMKVVAGFSIWNGLNHSNIISNYYTLDENQNYEEIKNQALKFTPNFSVRLHF